MIRKNLNLREEIVWSQYYTMVSFFNTSSKDEKKTA